MDRLTVKQGEDFVRQFAVERGTDAVLTSAQEIWFTLKTDRDQADPGVAQVTLTGSGIVIDDSENFTVTIPSAVTAAIPAGPYEWDYRIKELSGRISNPQEGIFIVEKPVSAST